MNAIETIQHASKTITIYQDTDAETPRDWDNAGTLVCFHRRYELGDKDHGYRSDDYSSWAELEKAIIREHKPVVILPLSLIDHSGISIYVGGGAHACDPGGWDSGQIGFAYVTRESALKEWGKGKRVTAKVRARAKACLEAEIEVYDQYLRGDTYGYCVRNEDDVDLDSCCGFFGMESVIEAAKESAESITAHEKD